MNLRTDIKQSPWAAAPKNNWKAELQDRLEKDFDRHGAVRDDDTAFFKANPNRRFHIRPATPHERYLDPTVKLALVPRLAGSAYVQFLIRRTYPDFDPAEHDNDAAGQELFDLCLKTVNPTFASQVRKLEKLQNKTRGKR